MKTLKKLGLIFLVTSVLLLAAFNGIALADGFEPVIANNNATQVYLSPNVSTDGIAFAYIPGSLYRSKDGGKTWTSVAFQLEDLAFIPSGKVMLSGTQGKYALYSSSDGGATWNPVDQLNFMDYSSNYSANVPDEIVSAGNSLLGNFAGSVKISGDGGLTWPNGISGNIFTDPGSIAVINDQTYLAIRSDNNIVRTDDGGKTWNVTGVTTGKGPAPVSFRTDTNYFAIPSISAVPGFIAINSPNAPGLIYTSRDDGLTWSKINAPNFAMSSGGPEEIALCTAVAPGGYIFAGTNDGVLISEDYGETWKPAENNINGSVTEIACQQDGDQILVLASAHGLYRMEYTKANIAQQVGPTNPAPAPDQQSAQTQTGVIRFVVGESNYISGDHEAPMDAAPFISGGRILVPVRYLADALGAQTSWDSQTEEITVSRGATTIELRINENNIVINGNAQEMDVAPVMSDGRTYLPARYVAEALGYTISWNMHTQTLAITPGQ
jgi:photosystem II stability/assembly factor-like uncharacterized protein